MATTELLLSLPLRSDTDVVGLRTAARRLAERVGFDRPAQTRLATAVSEIARNAVVHGGGGEATFGLERNGRTPRLAISIADRGPGIAGLDELLAGQRPFEPGHGRGLTSARRLVEDFRIDSAPGHGTRVVLAQPLPRGATPDTPALREFARSLGRQNVDAMTALREQNGELIDSIEVLRQRDDEAGRLNRELEDTNRGVVALYSELEDKAEQLREVSDLKSRFLSHMSHEFRTPLSSILALARLLSDHVDGDLTVEQERQVEYIRRSAQGLLELVNDLLDLSKVEAGKLNIKPVSFAVSDLFGSLRGALKPLQRKASVELSFDDASGLPAVHADESRVAQVLRNFISNALKFTEIGHVRVRAEHDEGSGQIVFSVEDTGIGIAPEHRQVIFEEFSQIDGPLQKGGTGLGLALARRLATLLGGSVSVDSEPGRGSVFRLAVPLRWGEPAATRAEESGRPCLLIVDDEESFRYVIRQIARESGYAVQEAEDGIEGLRVSAEIRPDIIVLDLQMPRMDGYAMLARLQEDAVLSRVPVIVCTSLALTLDHKRRLAAAYAIVPKHDLSRDGLDALIRAAVPGLGAQP